MPFVSVMPNSSLAYWAIYRILPFVLLLWVVLLRTLKLRDYPSVRFGPPELSMLILGIIVPSSILLLQAHPNVPLIRFGDRFLLPFCMYLVIRLTAPREREFVWLQWVAVFIAVSQSLIWFLSWYAPQRLPEVWHYLQGARTTGSLKDPDLYAAILTFAGMILIHSAVNRKSGLVRLGFLLATSLCAVFAFLSLERAAWLGGFFVTIGLMILYPKTMFRLILIGCIVIAIMANGILSSHIDLSVKRFSETNQIYDRFVVFDAMLQMFRMKPVWGWGYETLDDNIQPFYRRVGEASLTRMITSHNTYLTVLTELGLVGFILYMFPVVWWLVLSIRVWRRIPDEGLWSKKLLAVIWLGMLFQFIVSNFFDMRWFPIGLTLWWLMLGLIADIVYPYLKGRDIGATVPINGHSNG